MTPATTGAGAPGDRPHLMLVRGDATPEEVAAIIAVLAARAAAAGAGAAAPVRRSAWADPRQSLRREPVSGPGAWTRSGFDPGVRTRADW